MNGVSEPTLPQTYAYVIESAHRRVTLRAALERAAFVLRKEGLGGIDHENAMILESIQFKEPTT